MTDSVHDPERDPALAEALRRAGGEPPFDEVDWAGLRGRIGAGAELPLARLRREAAPSALSSARLRAAPRWRRVAGVAAAACVGAVALAGTLRLVPGAGAEGAPDPLPPREAMVVEEIVSASLPDGLPALISGEAAADALLEAAVGS